MKLAITRNRILATTGLLVALTASSAFAALPAWSTWKKSPLELKFPATNPSCKIAINGLTQDNPGQTIRVSYTNKNVVRKQFKLAIQIKPSSGPAYFTSLMVDNVNPSEQGERNTGSPNYSGLITEPGTVIKVRLEECSTRS